MSPRSHRRPTFLPLLGALGLLLAFEAVLLWLGWRSGLPPAYLVGGAVFSVLLVAGAALTLVPIQRTQARLLREERQLGDLQHRAARLFGAEHLEEVLQRVVDEATELLEARYGALSVEGHQGQILEFVFTGLPDPDARLLPHPPKGEGLLGVPLHEGQRLRVPRIERDPRSSGMPPGHPPMTSLLAVPVPCEGPFRGNLYLTDKLDGEAFGDGDEETLVRFARVAGVAIDTAHLRQQQEALAVTEERLRIAREMHDGMSQVLAYVNTKTQAVGDILRSGRTDEASAQLDQLAAASREAYSQVREGILALRTDLTPERDLGQALTDYIDRWRHQHGSSGGGAGGLAIELEMGPVDDIRLSPIAQLQMLRIIQEAMANVRKHARASRVTVRLAQRGNLLEAEIEDDGVGFDPGSVVGASHFGLEVMAERAETVDGHLVVDSAPGRGTRIQVRLPLTPPVL